MSTPNKPRGGSDSELTKLKALPATKREAIWGWLAELEDGKPLTNAAVRNRLATQFGIRLQRDGQLSVFWSWQAHQMRTESYNAKIEQFEEFYAAQNPNASRDRVRDAAIAFFMTETAANGDREGFVDMANLDLREREGATRARHEERKISVSERRVALLEQKSAAYDRAKAALNEAKGGITPETLERIERELKLF
jgi:hypothetical protein